MIPYQLRSTRLSLVSPGKPIACCVQVDRKFAPKVRYALDMLLIPLGLEPQWVDTPLDALYYGPDEPSEARLVLAHAPQAPVFFARSRPFDPADAVQEKLLGESVPVLFADPHGRPDLPASTFLWLSGWQETAVGRWDEHGRATYAYSLAASLGTSMKPAVDAYREILARLLADAGIDVHPRTWGGKAWAFCPTHDVDYVRKWRAGIVYREMVQDLLLNRRLEPPGRRLRRASAVVRQMVKGDPFVRAMHEMPLDVAERGGTATYFVKAGAGDPHDVRYRVGSAFLKKWMQQLRAGGFEIGLHPSYRTPDEPDRLLNERNRLERAAGAPVTSVRQHYLRYDPARTARLHDDLGVKIDSTLGFSEHEGFRRGTCMPFRTYDLDEDRSTAVWEMPLALMDSAVFNRRACDVERAVDLSRALSDTCQKYGGAFVALWHTTLGDEIDCPGWRAHFLRTLDGAAKRDALITSLEEGLRSWM